MEEEKYRHDIESMPIDAIEYRGRNNNMYQHNVNIDSKNISK